MNSAWSAEEAAFQRRHAVLGYDLSLFTQPNESARPPMVVDQIMFIANFGRSLRDPLYLIKDVTNDRILQASSL